MPLSSSFELTGNWSGLVFSERIFEISRGRTMCWLLRHILMCRQKAPGVKGKIRSTLSWLGRLKVEGSATGDGGGPRQRKTLFEYVSLSDCERVYILILDSAELLKESRTSYSPCLSVPVRSGTRKTTKTYGPYAGSWRTSGTPLSSTRSVPISQLPSGCPVEAACSFTNRGRCTIRTVG